MKILAIDPGPEQSALIPGAMVGRLLLRERRVEKQGSRGSYSVWSCQCQCGVNLEIRHDSLKSRATLSCGCMGKERRKLSLTKHGGRRTREYGVWSSMWTRCANPNSKSFKDYGGRGISVAEEWKSFAKFLADMGARPSADHTIERSEVNKGYSASNCIWLKKSAQARNTRRSRFVVVAGERITIAELAERSGINYFTLRSRIDGGMEPAQAAL